MVPPSVQHVPYINVHIHQICLMLVDMHVHTYSHSHFYLLLCSEQRISVQNYFSALLVMEGAEPLQ